MPQVSTESAEDQTELLQHYPGVDVWRDLVHGWVLGSTKGAEGMPLSVQVAARPWQEEMVLRVLRELEDHARANGYH